MITDDSGRVVALDLYWNQLSGEIPPELGSLSSLAYLHLNSKSVERPDTAGAGRLVQPGMAAPQRQSVERGDTAGVGRPLSNGLWILDLSGNQLNGEIPPELAACPT